MGSEIGLTSKRRSKLLLLLALLIAAAVAYGPLSKLVLATRLLLAVRALASGETGEGLPVTQRKVQRRMGARDLEGIVYRPSTSNPEHAVMILAGVSELGCYHPRLVALSRTLADKGFLVLTPDIEMFRRFEVSPVVLDEITFWYEQIPGLEGGRNLRRAGIIGISFSGTLALIAAARPGMRDAVGFVMGIGPYQDLVRCTRIWFAAGPKTVGEGFYPTRFYGKWIIMLAALDMLESERERKFLHETLLLLLLQKPLPPVPKLLSPETRRWYRLATLPEDQSDPELSHAIEMHLEPLFRQLSPDEAASQVRCPVFLAHGASDDLIPPEESKKLRERIKQARSNLLISPFLTHTHPLDKELSWRQKTPAIWDMLWFFYQLARALR